MYDETSSGERFLRTLAEHETALAAYIRCLVNHSDADDILQETKIVLWRKFAEFTEGTDFRAWARTVALHQILNYRRKEKRRSNVHLDESFIEVLAAEMERRSAYLDATLDHLEHCLQKLSETHRMIVLARYYQKDDIDTIAGRMGRSTEAVYRILSRIRVALATCVERQIRQAGGI